MGFSDEARKVFAKAEFPNPPSDVPKEQKLSKCPICLAEYDKGGDHWKFCCYDCYKNMSFLVNKYDNPRAKRIKRYGFKSDVYLSHPSVTKEEMDEWIVKTGKKRGWGVEEWSPDKWGKYKIWINNVNYD